MKILNKLIWILLFLFLMIQVIISSDIIFNSIHEAIHLWFYKVVPSLLPFFLISHFLINYGLIEIMSELLKPLMHLLKMNEKTAFILIMSMFTGSPGNAFYIKEALNKNLITEEDATKALMFSQFASPLFILGTVHLTLNNFQISLLILIVTYLTNFILAFLCRNKNRVEDTSPISFIAIKNKLNENNSEKFGKVLANSIKKTFDTMIMILGSICFFYMITAIIEKMNILPDSIFPYVTGILEMTQGIYHISLLNIPIEMKAIIITIFLSFGGFSIHSQVISIISDTKIKYLPYLFARILHAMIAVGILSLLIQLL